MPPSDDPYLYPGVALPLGWIISLSAVRAVALSENV
jgi:hypothetical protein